MKLSHGKDLPARETASMFDAQPVTIGGFVLRGRSAEPIGTPTLDDWTFAFDYATHTEEASPYWVADLLAYADSRTEWSERLDQAKALTGLALQTLYAHNHVGTKVKGRARALAPSYSHAREVAKLDHDEQERWLDKARTEHWSSREMVKEIAASKRRNVIEGQAVLEGQYRVFLVDCPWLYGNKPPSGSGAQTHYKGLTIKQLCDLPVAAHATPNAVMFFWVPAPMVYENPGPREVIEAWDFKPKTGLVWDKVSHNFGNYVSIRHEHLFIATRGKCLPDRPTPMFDSVLTERQDGMHSSKPASVRTMIERLYDGPYIELFARERAEGWTSYGDDAALWLRTA